MKDYLPPEELDKMLKANYAFTFNGKISFWIIFFMVIGLIIGIVSTVILSSGAPDLIFLPITIMFFVELLLLYSIYYTLSKKIELNPEAIVIIKNNRVINQYNYDEIYNIEFYVLTTVINNVPSRENKIKITTKQGTTKKISADYWKTPKPLKSHILIQNIIKYYFNLNKVS